MAEKEEEKKKEEEYLLEFSIDRKEALGAVTRCERFTPKKSSLPILADVKIVAAGEVVSFQATDLEICFKEFLPGSIRRSGAICLPVSTLKKGLSGIGGNEVDVRVRKSDLVAEIGSGNRGEVQIPGLSAEDFPIIPDTDWKKANGIDGLVFAEMIERVEFAASTNTTQYNLLGVQFFAGKDDLVGMVATDGYRLSVCEKNEFGGIGLLSGEGVLVPRKVLVELVRLLRASKKDMEIGLEEVKVTENPEGKKEEKKPREFSRTFFRIGKSMELSARSIDAKFPDWQRIMPTEVSHQITFNRIDMLKVLDQVGGFLGKNSGVILYMDKEAGQMKILAKNVDVGEISKSVPVIFGKEPYSANLEIGINAKYMVEGLKAMSETDVMMGLHDDVSPVIFIPVGNKEHKYVVVLMRL